MSRNPLKLDEEELQILRDFERARTADRLERAVAEIVHIQERRRHRANKKMERTRKTRRSS